MAASETVGIRTENFEGSFIIEQFEISRELKKKGEALRSPLLATIEGHALYLRIFPRGNDQVTDTEDFVSVYLSRDSEASANTEVALRLSVAVVGANNATVREVTYTTLWDLRKQQHMNGWVRFWEWSLCKNNGIVNGSMKLAWKLIAFIGDYQAKNAAVANAPITCSLAADLGVLFTSGAGADLTIRFDGGQCMVHKAVLIARSDVFRSMFSHQMTETSTNCVNIEDADEQSVKTFLRYLYTDQLGSKEQDQHDVDLCCSLLPLAKKYQVPGLVQLCCSRLITSLADSNAADLLRLADMLEVASLKETCLKYIVRSPNTVRAVQDTEAFDKLSADLVREVLAAAFTRPAKRQRVKEEREFPNDSDWERLTAAQLRRACGERGLSSTGTKPMLQARLPS